MSNTLYDALADWSGTTGLSADQAIDAAVTNFYERNLADERINQFFGDVDLDRLKGHQFNFLRYAFSEGRVGNYTGRSIERAHRRLIEDGLNATHFDCVAENLVTTLNQLSLPDEIVNGIVAVVVPLRSLFEEAAGES